MDRPPLTPASSEKDSPVILVVDDERSMRFILSQAMKQQGYKVLEASTGEECLEIYLAVKPDLVLLDAILPDLAGFEVCRQLQALAGTEPPLVLMVTSLEDAASVDKAFQAGATDYVTKPIHWPILQQRIRRLFASRQLEKLRHDLIHMIVHDMKSPLASMSGHLELLSYSGKETLSPAQQELVARASRSTQNLLDMVMMILDLRRMEEGKLSLERQAANVLEMLKLVISNLDWMSQTYQVELVAESEEPELVAEMDWNLIQRVLTNLISNAIKHSFSNSQVFIKIARRPSGELCIAVKDVGEGISLPDQWHIFNRYSQASQRIGGSRTDTGLGLTFCKLAMEAHSGRIELESAVGVGSTFSLIFPA